MSEPCKNCDRPLDVCDAERLKELHNAAFFQYMNRRFDSDLVSVRQLKRAWKATSGHAHDAGADCHAHAVDWRAEALSLRVAAAANLEMLRALKCVVLKSSESFDLGYNAAIDAAIRVLGGE